MSASAPLTEIRSTSMSAPFDKPAPSSGSAPTFQISDQCTAPPVLTYATNFKTGLVYEQMSIIGKMSFLVSDLLISKTSYVITRLNNIKENINQLVCAVSHMKVMEPSNHKEVSNLKKYIDNYNTLLSREKSELTKICNRDKVECAKKFIGSIPFDKNIEESVSGSIERIKCIGTRMMDIKRKITRSPCIFHDPTLCEILDILDTIRVELSAEFKYCENIIPYFRTIEKFSLSHQDKINYYLRTDFCGNSLPLQ